MAGDEEPDMVFTPKVLKKDRTDLNITVLKESETISIDLDTFNIVEVRDFEDPSKTGTATYDEKANALYVYMADHQSNFELNKEAFILNLQKGYKNFALSRIGSYDTDESKLPACKFFVPSKQREDAELPSNWRYTNGFIHPSCISAEMGCSTKKPGQCAPYQTNGGDMTRCRGFEKLEDQTFIEVLDKATREVIVTVSKHYDLHRVVTFTTDDNPDLVIKSADDANQYVDKNFDSDLTDIRLPEQEKTSYFDKVFV